MPEGVSPGDQYFRLGLSALEMLRSADHFNEYQSDLEDAVAAFTRAIEADPRHLDALRGRAASLARLDRWLEAVDSYDAAVGLAPEDADLRVGFAHALAKVQRHGDALREFDEALRRRESVAALYGRADTLTALERFEPAVAAWDAVLSVRDEGPIGWTPFWTGPLEGFHQSRARAMRAICLATISRPGADTAFRLAFEDTGPRINGWFRPKELTAAVVRFEAARTGFRQWIEAHAADPRTWRTAVEIWLGAGRVAEALTAAEQLVRLTPDDARAWADKGGAHEAAGQLEPARSAYRRALAIWPEFALASMRLDALER